MHHPDMLTLHQSRVSIFAQVLWERLKIPNINLDYMAVLGAHHDSPEFISPFWDVPTPLKMRLQLKNLRTFRMIDRLTETNAEGIIGLEEWFYAEYRDMSVIEHHLVKLADILDAFFVAVMEVRSGNSEFEDKINWASSGRFHQLAKSEILNKIDFKEHAYELIQFARDIHTKNPPALYTLWRKVHKEVQDDIARRVWTWELGEYPDTVMSPIVSYT